MPPKKATAPGSVFRTLDPNQGDEALLREARNQKRKANSPKPREQELDEEINNLELIHQQIEKRKEKMLRLSELQKKIDEAAEEMRNIEAHDNQHKNQEHDNLRHEEFNFQDFLYDEASPLTPELQATPWSPLYRPPTLPMYDGLSDPKQFLMSYEATISSYGGNSAVMAKSFVMAVRSVAQTWYSSLRPRTVTSWPKLKEMLLTSFQGFQSKPVTAQALFQCTQEPDEYLQSFVRRFLRLRAQAPAVQDDIVIEAMVKGLRPGPAAQYFARKPPHSLEKLLQKMDEYIRADNDFRQRREELHRFTEAARGFGGRFHPRHVRSIQNPTQAEEKTTQSQGQSGQQQANSQQHPSLNTFRPSAPRGGRGGRSFGGRFNGPPRKPFCLFCGEDKGHTTRTCHHTINKQKELASSAPQSSQPKEVFSTSSYCSPYIPQYVQPQLQEPRLHTPSASNASSNHTMSAWSPSASFVPGPPPYDQVPAGHPKFPVQDAQQRDRREGSETRTVNSTVPETKHIY